jgi:hypothetical protein
MTSGLPAWKTNCATVKDDVVISDCRFPNEIRAIKQAGGIVVRVVRGPEPEWYDAAVSNRGPNGNSTWALSGRRLEQLGVHASKLPGWAPNLMWCWTTTVP